MLRLVTVFQVVVWWVRGAHRRFSLGRHSSVCLVYRSGTAATLHELPFRCVTDAVTVTYYNVTVITQSIVLYYNKTFQSWMAQLSLFGIPLWYSSNCLLPFRCVTDAVTVTYYYVNHLEHCCTAVIKTVDVIPCALSCSEGVLLWGSQVCSLVNVGRSMAVRATWWFSCQLPSQWQKCPLNISQCHWLHQAILTVLHVTSLSGWVTSSLYRLIFQCIGNYNNNYYY